MSSDTIPSPEGIDREDHSEQAGCPECSGDLREVDGETYCTECGFLSDEYWIDHGPEWHRYDAKERRRTGMPLTEARHDRGLYTEIGKYVDGNGKPLSERRRRRLKGLKREHSRGRFRSKAERNLAHGIEDIMRISGALDLPTEVKHRACAIYRAAHADGLLRGRSIDSVAAGSIYAACRCLGLPRQVVEIEAYSHVDGDRIWMAYSVIQRELKLPTRPVRPRDFVPRLASATEVPDVVSHRALELVECAEDSGVANGRNPAGVAAACLYHASIETGYRVTPSGTLTQKVLGEHAGVSSMTIRTNWKNLQELCGQS